MAATIAGYIRMVVPGSKTPWQASYRPVQGETLQLGQSNTIQDLFKSVKDAEVAIESHVGKKLAWRQAAESAANMPLYIGELIS